MAELHGRRVLVLAGDDYEDLELWYPRLRALEAGAEVVTAGLEAGRRYSGKHGYPCVTDAAVGSVPAAELDAVICPGGWMPDKLRRDPAVLAIVRALAGSNRCVAAICHGGWIPISAGVYRDVRVTASPGIKDDLVNAGAIWLDAPVVIDRWSVSSRKPDDLPDFCRALIEVVAAQPRLA